MVYVTDMKEIGDHPLVLEEAKKDGMEGWTECCSLFADSPNELIAFATSIGLGAKAYIGKYHEPIFRLTQEMRGRTLAAGAAEGEGVYCERLAQFLNQNVLPALDALRRSLEDGQNEGDLS